jgi:hypothetical protein
MPCDAQAGQRLVRALSRAETWDTRRALLQTLVSELRDPESVTFFLQETKLRSVLGQLIERALRAAQPHIVDLLDLTMQVIKCLVKSMQREDVVDFLEESKSLVHGLKALRKLGRSKGVSAENFVADASEKAWGERLATLREQAANIIAEMEQVAGREKPSTPSAPEETPEAGESRSLPVAVHAPVQTTDSSHPGTAEASVHANTDASNASAKAAASQDDTSEPAQSTVGEHETPLAVGALSSFASADASMKTGRKRPRPRPERDTALPAFTSSSDEASQSVSARATESVGTQPTVDVSVADASLLPQQASAHVTAARAERMHHSDALETTSPPGGTIPGRCANEATHHVPTPTVRDAGHTGDIAEKEASSAESTSFVAPEEAAATCAITNRSAKRAKMEAPRPALRIRTSADASSTKLARKPASKRVHFAPEPVLVQVYAFEYIPDERTHAPVNLAGIVADTDEPALDRESGATSATKERSTHAPGNGFSEVVEEGRLMQKKRQHRQKVLAEMREDATFYPPPHVESSCPLGAAGECEQLSDVLANGSTVGCVPRNADSHQSGTIGVVSPGSLSSGVPDEPMPPSPPRERSLDRQTPPPSLRVIPEYRVEHPAPTSFSYTPAGALAPAGTPEATVSAPAAATTANLLTSFHGTRGPSTLDPTRLQTKPSDRIQPPHLETSLWSAIPPNTSGTPVSAISQGQHTDLLQRNQIDEAILQHFLLVKDEETRLQLLCDENVLRVVQKYAEEKQREAALQYAHGYRHANAAPGNQWSGYPAPAPAPAPACTIIISSTGESSSRSGTRQYTAHRRCSGGLAAHRVSMDAEMRTRASAAAVYARAERVFPRITRTLCPGTAYVA